MAHGEGATILPVNNKKHEDWLKDYGFVYSKTIFGWIKHPNNYSSLIILLRDNSVTGVYVTEGKKVVAEDKASPWEAVQEIQKFVGAPLL